MKKRRLFGKFLRGVLMCALLATLSFALVACKSCKGGKGKSPDKQVEFTGVKDVHISVSETDYDFSKGVLAVDSVGKTLEITIDDSAVKFGTAGQYTVKYDTANGSSECTVYIYGAPIIETSTLDIPYTVATEAGKAITSVESARHRTADARGRSKERRKSCGGASADSTTARNTATNRLRWKKAYYKKPS